jgi:hypothetical protein
VTRACQSINCTLPGSVSAKKAPNQTILSPSPQWFTVQNLLRSGVPELHWLSASDHMLLLWGRMQRGSKYSSPTTNVSALQFVLCVFASRRMGQLEWLERMPKFGGSHFWTAFGHQHANPQSGLFAPTQWMHTLSRNIHVRVSFFCQLIKARVTMERIAGGGFAFFYHFNIIKRVTHLKKSRFQQRQTKG